MEGKKNAWAVCERKGKEGIDWDMTWQCIAKKDLKGCIEALICSAQEQALRKIIRDFTLIAQWNLLCAECAEARVKWWPMWWMSAVSWR